MDLPLTPPMEDYLETIGEVCRDQGVARVKEIATRMEVSNPSVVRALRTLKRRRLVEQERYGHVRLTDEGQRVAREILGRHQTLAEFLEHVLGLDPATASRDACRIEHAVSPQTMRRLRAAVAFLRGSAHADLHWSSEFARFCEKRTRGDRR
jgi:DtxR family Mn-dependent transcriptional regulator